MRAQFLKELAEAGLPGTPVTDQLVSEADIAGLPPVVQRYFRFMGAIGRPRIWSFRLSFNGRFRLGPQKKWMKCETWQYNNGLPVARLFHIRLRMGGIVPVLARDSYVGGCGRMLVRLLDRLTLADGTGEEFDIGELTTYLNDGIMLAPSILLRSEVNWRPVDASAFDVMLSDHGHTVGARVFVDERGAPTNFSTTDRFLANTKAGKPIRARWTTPMEGWQDIEGRRLPVRGQAIWHLPEGEFTYADFTLEPHSLAFNVIPGA